MAHNTIIARIAVPKATEEELRAYQAHKDKLFLESLNDKSKQTPMKPIGCGRIGVTKFGLCPVCKSAVVGDGFCKECFQVLDWSEV